MVYLYVGIGGFFGSIARYLMSLLFIQEQSSFPLATLFVNLLGSFLLAYLTFYVFEKMTLSKQVQLAITTGFLGSFTTFSAFSVETMTLLQNEQFFFATLYVVMSVVGGLSMAYIAYRCKGETTS